MKINELDQIYINSHTNFLLNLDECETGFEVLKIWDEPKPFESWSYAFKIQKPATNRIYMLFIEHDRWLLYVCDDEGCLYGRKAHMKGHIKSLKWRPKNED